MSLNGEKIQKDATVENTSYSPLTYERLLKLLGEESGKCISCGFCDSVCPTYPASGYDPVITARGRAQTGKRLFDELVEHGTSSLPVSDSFYSCLDCHACIQVCPTGVDAGRVSDLAKGILASGKPEMDRSTKPTARMIVAATMKYNNPLGVGKNCADWAGNLKFEGASDTLLFTGNMYQLMAYSKSMRKARESLGESVSNALSGLLSHAPFLLRLSARRYDEGVMKVMQRNLRNIVYLLEQSGVMFTYMGESEPYPGTFLYDLGYYREFEEYANRIHDIFTESGYRKVITVDPHTYELLRYVYPKFVRNYSIEVYHYLDLIDHRRLGRSEVSTVFHEPCHFALSGESYKKPGEILSKISEMKLPERSGKRTFCCGGPNELLFGGLSDRISEMRFKQLKDANTERIVTACPICYVNLAKDDSVYDLSDMIKDAFSQVSDPLI